MIGANGKSALTRGQSTARHILPRLPAQRGPGTGCRQIVPAFAAMHRISHGVIEKPLSMTRATAVSIERRGGQMHPSATATGLAGFEVMGKSGRVECDIALTLGLLQNHLPAAYLGEGEAGISCFPSPRVASL